MLTGYKFESIRALRSENVIAWEVLSTAKPHVNLEDYFGSLPSTQRKAHFFAQLRHAMFCEEVDKFYLNATSDLLLETDFLDRLKEDTPCPERLAIEVTDLYTLIQLDASQSRALRKCIATLHQWGIEVWADDVCEDILSDLLTSQIRFCGVKIDKHTFWSGRTEQAKFLHLTRQFKNVASKVLIEGIETAGDFALARASVADYGQGYLWGQK
ncbi:EAL domain-containing protein [Enterobacter sp. UNJFSC 003]|uniref:EAL domain-containing protein n=1 Tax=Enterobacter sp. UNJFSC 003 TaxID=3122077 RepID=UPI002EBA5E75|nr:EAL domain-containing protein [Serratia liquefaciens]